MPKSFLMRRYKLISQNEWENMVYRNLVQENNNAMDGGNYTERTNEQSGSLKGNQYNDKTTNRKDIIIKTKPSNTKAPEEVKEYSRYNQSYKSFYYNMTPKENSYNSIVNDKTNAISNRNNVISEKRKYTNVDFRTTTINECNIKRYDNDNTYRRDNFNQQLYPQIIEEKTSYDTLIPSPTGDFPYNQFYNESRNIVNDKTHPYEYLKKNTEHDNKIYDVKQEYLQGYQYKQEKLQNNQIISSKYTKSHNNIVNYNFQSKFKLHQCKVCLKSFQRASSLSNHRLIHSKTKSYHCQECNMDFLRKSDLAKHMIVHSGNKPYQCNICGKKFSQSSNMLTHQRRHSGVRPYSCLYCGKSFYRKVDVRRHSTVHRKC